MSCGLGAVILLFMLVKHNVDNTVLETELLDADAVRLESNRDSVRQEILRIQSLTRQRAMELQVVSQEIELLNKSLKTVDKEGDRLSKHKSEIEKRISKLPPLKTTDVVDSKRGGEENYLMGLRVEGGKIAILLDSSASMTDEKLIDILRRKSSSERVKKNGPKWKRSKAIVKWLLARVPQSSRVQVSTYSNVTKALGGPGWKRGRDPKSLSKILNDLEKVIPVGSTNLQLGLAAISSQTPTNIYLITDGLPTQGQSNYGALNPFASCNSLLGKSTTISGECRVKLFRQSIAESAPKYGAVVNVILLPLEGDSEASPEYWVWTAGTGGLLISPALSWP